MSSFIREIQRSSLRDSCKQTRGCILDSSMNQHLTRLYNRKILMRIGNRKVSSNFRAGTCQRKNKHDFIIKISFYILSATNNSMEQCPPGEAASHSATNETRCLLWNRKVLYRVHNSPPLVLIVKQMNSFHKFRPN